MAQFLEKLGFDQLWLPDHLLFPEASPAFDPWMVMGAMAVKTSKAQFGPAVTDPHRTHPAVLAQRLATLDQMSKGRVILGLGSGEAMNLDPFGISWRERKVGKMKEFIAVVRGLLDSKEPFTFEGDFYQLDRARLTVRPYKDRHIPIYMAALGPMMQGLAGRTVDGWFPTVIPADYFDSYFEKMGNSAERAGRDPDALAKVATVVCGLNTDGKTSKQDLIDYLRPLGGALVWAPVLERLGLDFSPPSKAQSSYMDVNPCDPESLERYFALERWLPDELISPSLTHGSPEDILKTCRDFEKAGATHLQIFFGSTDPIGSFLQFANLVMPKLKGVPPTLLARSLFALLRIPIEKGWVKKRFPAPPMRIPDPVEA